MTIFHYLRLLWFRYLSRGDVKILLRLDDIERKLDKLTPRDISPEFAAELVKSLRLVDKAVKRIATDD